ncbi:MAG: peptidylprolyl isomerase [Planctomycetota bacterium]|jgi:peptidyl-prolyl cis-trans isomerase SurA
MPTQRLLAVAGLLIPLTLAACEPLPDPVVAVIDGQPVLQSEYAHALFEAQAHAYFPRFVEARLVEAAAARAGVRVSPEEVTAAVDAQLKEVLQSRFAGSLQALGAHLEKYELTVPTWRAAREAEAYVRLLAERTLVAETREDRLKAAFEAKYGPGGVQREVRHLLYSTNVGNSRLYERETYDAEKAQIEADARQLATRLRARLDDGADFAELAAAHSDDYSASRGGELGTRWAGRFGRAFDDAVGGLEPGARTPVVRARRGFHIAEVTGIRRGARYTGRHIFVAADRDAPDGQADAVARAEALRARIDGGEDFAAVAREASGDPVTGARGGDLGTFGPERLGSRVALALQDLEPGHVSRPLEADNGAHIVELSSRDWIPAKDEKRVRHILISTEFNKVKRRRIGADLEARARARAEAAMERLRRGADFEALAEAESEDELSRRNGGRIARGRFDSFGPEVTAALQSMDAGARQIVRGTRGFHVLEVAKLERTAMADVRAELEKAVAGEPPSEREVKAWIDGLRVRATVEKKF